MWWWRRVVKVTDIRNYINLSRDYFHLVVWFILGYVLGNIFLPIFFFNRTILVWITQLLIGYFSSIMMLNLFFHYNKKNTIRNHNLPSYSLLKTTWDKELRYLRTYRPRSLLEPGKNIKVRLLLLHTWSSNGIKATRQQLYSIQLISVTLQCCIQKYS